MPLVGENDRKILYFYCPKELKLLFEEEEVPLLFSNILSIEYLCDYETNLMHMLKLVLKLDLRRKLWIIKHRKKLKVKFEFAKRRHEPDMTECDECEEEFIDDTYKPLFLENDTSIDSESLIKSLEDENDTEDGDVDQENLLNSEETIEIYLFNDDLTKASRKNVNKIYKKETLQNIVAHLLTETKHPAVLMDKFENEEEYYELLVPCMPLFKSLLYLDQHFGFYETGSLIFYDLDRLYIMNLNMKEPSCQDEEETHVNLLIDQQNYVTPGRGMIEKEDDDEYYLSLAENDLNIIKYSRSKEEETGSEFQLNMINPELGEAEAREEDFNFKAKVEYIGEERMKKFITIDHENKYADKVLKYQTEANESVIYIVTQNIDVEVLCPNKVYKMIFAEEKKDKIYKEVRYRVAFHHTYFKPEGDVFMACASKFILKKCSGELKEEAMEEIAQEIGMA